MLYRSCRRRSLILDSLGRTWTAARLITRSEIRAFQFSGRIRSFRHAIAGVLRMIQCQHNAWIHAAATLVVLAAAFVLRISAADWCWIILAISIVWTAEALNTAFEFLADAALTRVSPACP